MIVSFLAGGACENPERLEKTKHESRGKTPIASVNRGPGMPEKQILKFSLMDYGRLVPKTTRTQDNSYPRRLVPRTTRTQDDSYPRKFVPRTSRMVLFKITRNFTVGQIKTSFESSHLVLTIISQNVLIPSSSTKERTLRICAHKMSLQLIIPPSPSYESWVSIQLIIHPMQELCRSINKSV